ncbi:MAG: NfeD family protein [Clostridia bacterium]
MNLAFIAVAMPLAGQSFFEQYFGALGPAVIICLVVGLVLMMIEMATPGIGIPGAIGAVALIAAIVLTAAGSGQNAFFNALITLAIILVILLVAALFIFRSFNKGALSRSPIILKDKIDGDSNSLSDQEMKDMIGRRGICVNTLRPAGNAEFDGKKLDVVSKGEFIQRGTPVRIVAVDGTKILVVSDENKTL